MESSKANYLKTFGEDMKIVYLSRSVIPSRAANSINVMKMCHAMASLGHDVTLLGHFKTDEIKACSFYGVTPIFRSLSIPSISGHATDGPYIFGSWIRALELKPDLAYGRSLETCLLTALSGIPTLFEAHKFPKTVLANFCARLLFRLPAFVGLVVITKKLAELFVRQGFLDPPRILVAPSGACHHESNNSSRSKILEMIPPEARNFDLQVGYTGHLYPGKGMEIISQLAPLAPWAYFHIIGGRDEDVSFWKARIGRLPNVHFYGFVPPSLAPAFREIFEVALAPYQKKVRNSGTGIDTGDNISPLKVIEYMSAGLPVMASNLESIGEIIRHGETGFLIPPDDIDAWLRCLKHLRDNPEERKKIGLRARSVFLESYTWDARARKILSFVQAYLPAASASSTRNSISDGSGGARPNSSRAILSSSE